MSTVVICGKEYELTNEPIHGIVRALTEKQKAITYEFLFKNKDMLNDKTEVSMAVKIIAETRPTAFAEYDNTLVNFELIGTLSLATNHLFTQDEIDSMKQKELMEVYETCKKALGGGGMEYFFGGLRTNTLLKASEAVTKASQVSPAKSQDRKPLKSSSTKVEKKK
jgi:hypothetical protein